MRIPTRPTVPLASPTSIPLTLSTIPIRPHQLIQKLPLPCRILRARTLAHMQIRHARFMFAQPVVALWYRGGRTLERIEYACR
jgi:hypothetical protein